MLQICPNCKTSFPYTGNKGKDYTENTILVEGGDDTALIYGLIQQNNLQINNLTIEDKDGYQGILNRLRNIDLNSGSASIKKLLVLADADDKGARYRLKEIKTALRGKGFTFPKSLRTLSPLRANKKQLGVFIFPNNKNKGVLEELCLKTVIHPQKLTHIDKHIETIHQKGLLTTSAVKLPKSKMHIYMSTSKNPTGNISGAINAKEIDLASPKYNSLVGFLKLLQ